MSDVPHKPEPREPWLDRSIGLLDRSAEALDAATLSRLTQARHAAAAASARRPRWQRPGLVGAIGVAACALVLGIAVRRPQAPPSAIAPVTAVDALAADDDDLGLYEDLDFYAWLDAEQHDGEG